MSSNEVHVKHTVHTDALETLGMIHFKLEGRDAVHLAVEPMEAGERLEPGEMIGHNGDGYAFKNGVKIVGIVDPFLPRPVEKGQKFWLMVFPRQIKSLRHVWSHRDFPEAE